MARDPNSFNIVQEFSLKLDKILVKSWTLVKLEFTQFVYTRLQFVYLDKWQCTDHPDELCKESVLAIVRDHSESLNLSPQRLREVEVTTFHLWKRIFLRNPYLIFDQDKISIYVRNPDIGQKIGKYLSFNHE